MAIRQEDPVSHNMLRGTDVMSEIVVETNGQPLAIQRGLTLGPMVGLQ